jgi:hypothetical protein
VAAYPTYRFLGTFAETDCFGWKPECLSLRLEKRLLMIDLDDLDGDLEGATLIITPSAHVPAFATLRMLVKRGEEAMDEGATDVEIILPDGRHLDTHEVRQIDARFRLLEHSF